jgi:hypothetical protein
MRDALMAHRDMRASNVALYATRASLMENPRGQVVGLGVGQVWRTTVSQATSGSRRRVVMRVFAIAPTA